MAMMAPPPPLNVVSTSQKSRLMSPSTVMSSDIDLVALLRIWSARLKLSLMEMSESAYTSQMRSLLMMSRASTFFRISATPFSALTILFFFSKKNGMVTMPMVRMPFFLAMPATTGAAPVPVPPPIPAVTNTICVPSSSRCSICSAWSMAACCPLLGSPPAPRVPMAIFTGTGDFDKACVSVLHTANVTLAMPSSYILPTAFCPPPPTPITLMMFFDLSSTGATKSMSPFCRLPISKCSISVVLLQNYKKYESASDFCKPCGGRKFFLLIFAKDRLHSAIREQVLMALVGTIFA